MSPRARLVPLVAAGALALGAGEASAAPERPAAGQELVVVPNLRAVHAGPSTAAPRMGVVQPRRPITGTSTTLPVVASTTGADGRGWLRVRLPGRRLGAAAPPVTAWMAAAGTRRITTAWHLVVDLGARRVTAYRGGVALRRFAAIVGTGATPTPRGAAFVEENVRLPASRPGGPFALALSARSAVLQEFDGGPGQIALHGRRGIGGELGTAVSHGCVRLSDPAITWLAERIRPGVPVTVR